MSTDHSLEQRARRAARRAGCIAYKSRRYDPPNSYGEFMVVDAVGGFPVLGWRFDVSAQEVIEYFRR
ncbi:MAG: hypothetical protein ABI702_19675 [Burkholderiales bacterium]